MRSSKMMTAATTKRTTWLHEQTVTVMSDALTEPQRRVLALICRTNGGGIDPVSLSAGEQSAFRALVRRGLIQGKRGQPWLAVHTSDGWRRYINAMAD